MGDIAAGVLVDGSATGPVVVLDEPLSFWGGYDVDSGSIVGRHPQQGAVLAGAVVLMPGGRGSSSSSSVLAEAIHAGTGPAAIVLAEPDPMITLGVLVVAELYDEAIPVLTLWPAAYALVAEATDAVISAGGILTIG